MNNPETGGTTFRQKIRFILITAASSPLWLIAAVLFFAPFALLYILCAGLTVCLIAALAGVAACGAAISVTGIIYGALNITSTLPVGLYEIGFGIIVAGITMLIGILLYNAIVRLMPVLFGLVTDLLKFCFSKVKPLLGEYKRRSEGV